MLNTLKCHQAGRAGNWPACLFQVDASKPLRASCSAPQTLQNHGHKISDYLMHCIFNLSGINVTHLYIQPTIYNIIKYYLIKNNSYIKKKLKHLLNMA